MQRSTGVSFIRTLCGAVIVIVGATALRAILAPLDKELPFLGYALAVAVAAWWGGWAMALIVMVAGGVLGSVLFLDIRSVDQLAQIGLRLFFYFVVSLTAAWLTIRAARHFEHARQAQQRSLLDLQASEARLRQQADDLQRLTEALQEADRRKDVFLATLSHELRNPLAPLRNGLEVLKLAPQDRLAQARTREMMERQLSHLTRLVDDLLDLSRISRGTIVLRLATTGVRRLVEDAVEASQPLLESRGHHFTLDMPPDDLRIHADAGRITQALSNLLNNAARYTDPGGHISLRVSRVGEEVQFVVEDDGIGIAPDMREAVFEMFTQLASPDNSRGGLGIGLNIVRHLAQMHGGTVRADSQGVGHGSRFTLSLPMAR
ncbi:MAG: HAMP domain-containing sensor histidine kinase [Pseudomonadota bacterium]